METTTPGRGVLLRRRADGRGDATAGRAAGLARIRQPVRCVIYNSTIPPFYGVNIVCEAWTFVAYACTGVWSESEPAAAFVSPPPMLV